MMKMKINILFFMLLFSFFSSCLSINGTISVSDEGITIAYRMKIPLLYANAFSLNPSSYNDLRLPVPRNGDSIQGAEANITEQEEGEFLIIDAELFFSDKGSFLAFMSQYFILPESLDSPSFTVQVKPELLELDEQFSELLLTMYGDLEISVEFENLDLTYSVQQRTVELFSDNSLLAELEEL